MSEEKTSGIVARLFNRDLRSFMPQNGSYAHSTHLTFDDAFFTTLPLDVHPRILEGLSEEKSALICGIANSSALLADGTRAYKTFALNESDYDAFLFHYFTRNEKERQTLVKEQLAYFELLERILNGTREEFFISDAEDMSVPFLDENWRDTAAELLGDIDLEVYLRDVFPFDKRIETDAKRGIVSAHLFFEAVEAKSYVAEVSKCGFHEDMKNLISELLAQKKVIFTSSQRSAIDSFTIPPSYCGGIQYDAGAQALSRILERDIAELHEAKTHFNCLENGAAVVDIYAGLRFLHAQGYASLAAQLREKLTAAFFDSLKENVFFLDSHSDLDDIALAADNALNFIRTAHASDQAEVSARVMNELQQYKPIFADAQNKAAVFFEENERKHQVVNVLLETLAKEDA